MELKMPGLLDKFVRSWDQLNEFQRVWVEKLERQSKSDDQRRACFSVWARYSIALKTLRRICEPQYLPDCIVIARCCLEYEASLRAVLLEPEYVKKYLDFDKQAEAYHARLSERIGCSATRAKLEPDLLSEFGQDWRDEAKSNWCNISDLIKKLSGKEARRLYGLYSHFVHSSVIAVNLLDHRISHPEKWLSLCINGAYSAYLELTHRFLDVIWGAIVTGESESCKKNFEYVLEAYV
jgi:hypothetical protein